MSRVSQLRASLARCQHCKAYCERQLFDVAKSADMSDPQQQRPLQKLRSDLRRAESDVSWLQQQLDDLSSSSTTCTRIFGPRSVTSFMSAIGELYPMRWCRSFDIIARGWRLVGQAGRGPEPGSATKDHCTESFDDPPCFADCLSRKRPRPSSMTG